MGYDSTNIYSENVFFCCCFFFQFQNDGSLLVFVAVIAAADQKGGANTGTSSYRECLIWFPPRILYNDSLFEIKGSSREKPARDYKTRLRAQLNWA